MENNIGFLLSPLVVVCCFGAILTGRERLREKAKEATEVATFYGIAGLAAYTIPYLFMTEFKGVVFDLTGYLDWAWYISRPVDGAYWLAKEMPVDLVLYNPFYWLFIAFVWIFCGTGILLLVAAACNWTVLGAKMLIKGWTVRNE